jgi:hypothetical protein
MMFPIGELIDTDMDKLVQLVARKEPIDDASNNRPDRDPCDPHQGRDYRLRGHLYRSDISLGRVDGYGNRGRSPLRACGVRSRAHRAAPSSSKKLRSVSPAEFDVLAGCAAPGGGRPPCRSRSARGASVGSSWLPFRR